MSSSPRKILISGATGKQGGAVLTSLLSQRSTSSTPIEILALTRNPSSPKAQELAKKEGVTVVKGDLTDSESLEKALQGVDSAFLVTDFGQKGVEDEVKQGKTFIDAFNKASGRYLVFSSVGSADKAPTVPHFKSKYQVEQYLEANVKEWAVIRPVAFYDNFPTANGGGFALSMTLGVFAANTASGTKKVQWISVKDIGIVCAKALLEEDKFKGKKLELAGDEKSLNEVVEAASKAKGSKQGKVPLPKFITNLILPTELKVMFEWFVSTGFEANISEIKSIHPQVQDAEAFFREQFSQ